MKKIVIASALMLALSMSSGFAAPINNLGDGQTAIGLQNSDLYVEHKFSDTVTLGLQEHDIYGQMELNKNIRLIAGSKDYNDNSELYGGVGLTAPLMNKVEGYTSLVGGSGFKEVQVGANVNIASNLDLNLNYASLMPDQGSNRDRTSVGASFKF
jgi:hypothetical protein